MTTGLVHFDRPRQTLGFAKDAVDDFEASLRDFFQDDPFARLVELDPNTGYDIHKIKLVKPLPSVAIRRGTEAINNIKNAFDQATFAACAAIGKRPKKDIHFPWRCNPTDLERRFEKKDAVIPPDLREIFRRHEPYPCGEGYAGGNDQIRELSQIANDKHTVGFDVQGCCPVYRHPTITGKVSFFDLPSPVWDPMKNEMVMLVISQGANVQHDYQIAFNIIFSETQSLKSTPAVTALKMFLNKADEVCADLFSRCRELGFK